MKYPMSFAVVGYPRSGTTWVSNWLNTSTTLCLHDPLLTYTVEQLRELRFPRPWGVSCTVLMLLPDELASLTRRVAVLHRPLAECNASLRRVGLEPLLLDSQRSEDVSPARLRPGSFDAFDVQHRELFDPTIAARLLQHLLPNEEFDAVRHSELCRYNVQPNFERNDPNPVAIKSWALKAATITLELLQPSAASAPPK